MTRTRSHQPLRTTPGCRRWSAALGVAALLGAPLASGMHFAAVEHAVCPEHGEVMHVTAEGGSHDDGTVSGPTVLSGGGAAEGLGHEGDHCDVLSPSTSETRVASRGAVSLVQPAPPPALPGTEFPIESIDRLRLSPKSSPPRA